MALPNKFFDDSKLKSKPDNNESILRRSSRKSPPSPGMLDGRRATTLPDPSGVGTPPRGGYESIFRSVAMMPSNPPESLPSASPMGGYGAEFRSMSMMPQDMLPPTVGGVLPSPKGGFEQSKSAPVLSSGLTMPDSPALGIMPPGPTMVRSEPPKADPVGAIPDCPVLSQGWNPTEQECRLAPLPLFFPKDMIKLELPREQLDGVLERTSECIRSLSMQAEYQSEPVSAKLQTLEHIELFFHLWEAPGQETFYIDIQRRKGDRFNANRYIKKLLDAAKGIRSTCPCDCATDMSKQTLQNVESMIQMAMSGAPTQVPSESITKTAIDTVHSSLTCKRLNRRKMGLEHLAVYTDLKRTMSSTAVPSALVVLQGQAPIEEFSSNCLDIQSIWLRILQQREIEGCEEVCQDLMEVDCGLGEFLPSDGAVEGERPSLYVEYVSEVFHLALTILVNSLEVLACCPDKLGSDSGEIVLRFLQTCRRVTGIDISTTLLDCVNRSDRQLANGYLACKALRLLAALLPRVHVLLKSDGQTQSCLQKAVQLGRARHTMLQAESERLYETLYAS